MLPLMAGVLIASIGSGQLITRTGRYKVFPIVGTALMVVGMVLLSRLTASTTTLVADLYMLLLGLGLGFVMQVLVLAVQNAVDYRDLGIATASATLFRSMGGTVGVPIFGAIFSNQLATTLAAHLDVEAVAHLPARVSPDLIASLPAVIRDPYRAAYAEALHPVFLIAAGLAVAAFVATWFLQERPLRQTVADQGIGDSFASPRRRHLARRAGGSTQHARPAREPPSRLRAPRGGQRARRHARRSVAAAALRRRRFAHARRACGSPGRPRRRPPAAGHGAARARVAGGGACIGGRAPAPDRGRPRRDARDGRGAPRRTRALPRRLAARAAPRGPAAARALRPVAARTPAGRRAGSRLAPRRARRHSGTKRGAPRASNRARRLRSWLPCPWMARGRPIRPRTR